MECNSINAGTVLKYQVTAEAEGFDMERDDFEVELQLAGSGRRMAIPKEDMLTDQLGNFYFTFDTGQPGTGDYFARTVMLVPDTDADDDIRKVVNRQFLVRVEPTISSSPSKYGKQGNGSAGNCAGNVTFTMVWTVSLSDILYLADKDGNVIYDKNNEPIRLRKFGQ